MSNEKKESRSNQKNVKIKQLTTPKQTQPFHPPSNPPKLPQKAVESACPLLPLARPGVLGPPQAAQSPGGACSRDSTPSRVGVVSVRGIGVLGEMFYDVFFSRIAEGLAF